MKPFRYRGSVAVALSREFRGGGTHPDLSEHREPIDETYGPEDAAVEVDLLTVRGLVGHAVGQDWSDSELDQWLAPRLHYTLRIPRRVAGDEGFWTWLAIEGGNSYVLRRWLGKGASDPDVVTMFRYTGPILRNALGRLWWGAEMVRDGPSYEYVPPVFARVWTAEYALELRYSWYRPAPIAFTRVAEGLDGGPQLTTNEAKELSKRVNSYLSLRCLEGIGFDETVDEEWDLDWLARRPSLKEVLEADLRGPEDGFASQEAIEALARWFRSLSAELPKSGEAA